MIYSMTGFAAASAALEQGALSVELRAVNSRYLDIQFRLPDELRAFEPELREAIAARLSRGKAECRVGFAPLQGRQTLQLSEDLLLQLRELNRQVQAALPQAEGLRVIDVLRWPGALGAGELPLERLREACLSLLQQVLGEFAAARGREGDKLKAMLLERVVKMEQLAAAAAPRVPQALAACREKLAARLRDAELNCDDERIRQEIALCATRMDVDEELNRLAAHLAEVKRILAQGGVVGKRLDFMMQELNREANTLGSKSLDAEMSQIALELKLLIEQMREQIQNIE